MDFIIAWVTWLVSLLGLVSFFGLPELKPSPDTDGLGRLEHVIPRSFDEGEIKPAFVRISRDTSQDLFSALPADVQREFRSIHVEDAMQVSLVSSPGNAFDIISLTLSEQILPPSGYAHWEWDIEALKSGKQQLILTASIVLIDHNGNKNSRTEEIFRQAVNVDVSLIKTVRRFFDDNWEWVVGITTAVTAVAGMVIGYWQYKKS